MQQLLSDDDVPPPLSSAIRVALLRLACMACAFSFFFARGCSLISTWRSSPLLSQVVSSPVETGAAASEGLGSSAMMLDLIAF
jgi:hypothetical protein